MLQIDLVFFESRMIEFPHRLRRLHILVALLIVALGFSLRIGVLVGRANNPLDPAFIPVSGSDEATYYALAGQLANGILPTTPYYYHPGIYYAYAGMASIVGHNLIGLRLAIMLMDTLSIGAIIGAAWLVGKRPSMGYIAGLLYAFSPLAMFYSTTFWDTPLTCALVAWLLFLTVWQVQLPRFWRVVALGLLCGWLIVTRLNLAPLVLIIACVNGWTYRARLQTAILRTLALLLIAIGVIAPFTWWNYHITSGQFIPVATTGALELYMANNRDSTGIHGQTVALDTLNILPVDGIFRDLRLDFPHWVGLTLVKFARYWADGEMGNSYAYAEVRDGVGLLHSPLSHAVLCVLALVGLAFLWRRERALAFLLTVMLTWFVLSTTLTFTFSRIRFPVTPLLVVLSGMGVVGVWTWIQTRCISRMELGILVLGVFVLSTPYWITDSTAPKRTYTALPNDALALNVQFGDDLELVGWRTFRDDWNAPVNAWSNLDEVYTVELFWRLLQPTTTDYSFYLAYSENGERLTGYDQQLGNVSFPTLPTSQWGDAIYGEIVGFRLSETDTVRKTGEIRVGVYREDLNGQIERTFTTLPYEASDVMLQTFALYRGNEPIAPPTSEGRVFTSPQGDIIRLLSLEMPTMVMPNSAVTLRMVWQAETEITSDAQLFIHFMRPDGSLGQGYGLEPVPSLPTTTWKPFTVFTSEIEIVVPQEALTYEVFFGVIDQQSNERWTTDAPDSRPQIGEVVVGG